MLELTNYETDYSSSSSSVVVVVVVASWDNSSITLNVAGAQRRPATFNVIELRAKSSS